VGSQEEQEYRQAHDRMEVAQVCTGTQDRIKMALVRQCQTVHVLLSTLSLDRIEMAEVIQDAYL
jgi:hypothetical protein